MSANNETFNNAISLHQSKKFDEALTSYLKLLDESQSQAVTQEQAATVSHNISTLYMQQGDSSLAYIYNKKAMALDPGNSAAQQFYKSHFTNYKITEVPREIPVLEQINQLGLKYVPFELLAVLTIILMSLALKSLFRFYINKKKSFIRNENPNPVDFKFYVYTVLMIVFSSLLLIKNLNYTQPKGIIKAPLVAVQTSAGVNQATITEIAQGNIVQILQTKDIDGTIYAQIKIPGAFSGWIKKADLEPLQLNR